MIGLEKVCMVNAKSCTSDICFDAPWLSRTYRLTLHRPYPGYFDNAFCVKIRTQQLTKKRLPVPTSIIVW